MTKERVSFFSFFHFILEMNLCGFVDTILTHVLPTD